MKKALTAAILGKIGDNMHNPEAPATQKSSTKTCDLKQLAACSMMLRVLLPSLLLNLFLIGVMIGGTYYFVWSDRAPMAMQRNALRFAADELPSAQKQVFRQTLRQTRKAAAPLFTQGSAARAEVRQLLAQPEFNRTEIEAAIKKSREADAALRIRLETTLVDFAQSLSAADRIKFAQGLAKKGPLREQLREKMRQKVELNDQ